MFIKIKELEEDKLWRVNTNNAELVEVLENYGDSVGWSGIDFNEYVVEEGVIIGVSFLIDIDPFEFIIIEPVM